MALPQNGEQSDYTVIEQHMLCVVAIGDASVHGHFGALIIIASYEVDRNNCL
eukprot:SAG31_NODE_201_length_20535_cov_15.315081_4_plen_52_part_00